MDEQPGRRGRDSGGLHLVVSRRGSSRRPGKRRAVILRPVLADSAAVQQRSPVAGGALFGREAEVATLLDWLGEERLVTVAGPPGTGKTRLALEVARRDERLVRFVDLGGASTQAELLTAIADAAGTEIAGRAPALDVAKIARALDGVEVVLLLDDLDALVPHAAPLGALAAHAPILVTSRQPLGLEPERVFALDALDEEDAIALFRARAEQAGALREASRDVVQQIVETLDRLPLAIELAAARAGVLSPAKLLARLSESFGFLRSRRASGKHETLRDAIAWSWALLDDDERAALRQATVFAGAMSLDAAEAVLAVDGSVLDVLQRLRERFLLRAVEDPFGEIRFAPYASVRDFAAAEADDEERAAAVLRHARYFAERVRTWDRGLDGPERSTLIRRAALALADALAAHERMLRRAPEIAARIALALQRRILLTMRGDVRLALVQSSLEALPEGHALEPALRVAELYTLRLHRAPDHPELRARVAALPAIADPEVAADAALVTAILEVDAGRYADAIGALGHAASLAEEADAPRLVAAALDVLGVLHADEGDEAAAECFGRAIEHARAHHLDRYEARSRSHLGIHLHDRGALPRARLELERAVELATEGAEDWFRANYLLALATVLLEQDAHDLAASHVGTATQLARRSGDERVLAHARALGATLAAREGDLDAATDGFARSRAAMEGAGWWVAGVHAVLEGHVDLARHGASGEAAHLEQARHRIAEAPAESSMDVRVAVRVLRAAMSEDALVVGADGDYFEHAGERVDLRRRKAMRRMLAALADAREKTPGVALSLDALQAAGWPGEQMHPESGARRVYVGIGSLRKLGLGEVLVTADGGYMLDPAVPLRRG